VERHHCYRDPDERANEDEGQIKHIEGKPDAVPSLSIEEIGEIAAGGWAGKQ
jgi:hypothetical protein